MAKTTPRRDSLRERPVPLGDQVGALELGDHTEDLAAGDSMLFNANVAHTYENPDDDDEGRYHDVIIYLPR